MRGPPLLVLPLLVLLACSAEPGGAEPDGEGVGGSSATGGGASTGGSGPGVGTGGGPSGGAGSGGAPGSGGAEDPSVEIDCDLPELSAPLDEPTELLQVVPWAGRQAAISYTFDDGNSSQIQNYDVLNALGVPFTFYLVTNWGGAQSSIWEQAIVDGHEIGNHSHTHPEAGSGADLDAATQFIETNFDVTPLTMAVPYGNASYAPLAASRFLFNRGVGGGSIASQGAQDPYNLPTHVPAANANKAELDGAVSSAVAQGRWQTMTIHGFTGGSDGAYQPIPLNDFVEHVRGQRDSGWVWIDTLLDVGAYLIGHQLLTAAAPEVSGAGSTWSWTLPDHFPAGRCLRVQSSGRVFQDERPITENSLGYYELALDAGHVTIVAE